MLKFPDKVSGWLTPAEGQKLYELAKGKLVLEMGSYCGRSTICMAQSAKLVVAVDTFECTGTPSGHDRDTFIEFKRNLEEYDLLHKVYTLHGLFKDVLPSCSDLEPASFGLVFIDGSHDATSVEQDIRLALPLMRHDGVYAFHDYVRGGNHDVEKVVDEWRGERLIEVVDRLGVVRLS